MYSADCIKCPNALVEIPELYSGPRLLRTIWFAGGEYCKCRKLESLDENMYFVPTVHTVEGISSFGKDVKTKGSENAIPSTAFSVT